MRWYMVGTPMKYVHLPVCSDSATVAASNRRWASTLPPATSAWPSWSMNPVLWHSGTAMIVCNAGVEWNNVAYVSDAPTIASLLNNTPFGRLVVPDVYVRHAGAWPSLGTVATAPAEGGASDNARTRSRHR